MLLVTLIIIYTDTNDVVKLHHGMFKFKNSLGYVKLDCVAQCFTQTCDRIYYDDFVNDIVNKCSSFLYKHDHFGKHRCEVASFNFG